MKRILTFLLALTMLLALCACGGSAPRAESGSAAQAAPAETAAEEALAEAPTPEPTPEKDYVTKSAELLIRKTEEGVNDYDLRAGCGPISWSGDRVTEYAYDEFGAIAGETVRVFTDPEREALHNAEYADLTETTEAVYDDAGSLLSVSFNTGTIKYETGYIWSTRDTAYFEHDTMTRIERHFVGNQYVSWSDREFHAFDPEAEELLAEEVTMEYRENGSPLRETTEAWLTRFSGGIYLLEEPLVSIREYDEQGRCTLWRIAAWDFMQQNELGPVYDEYRWEFDGEGRPTSFRFQGGVGSIEETERSADLQYDEAGRAVSGTKTVDGVTTQYSYEYDGDGRVSAVVREGAGGRSRSDYEYGEDGLLVLDRRSDGNVEYSWEKQEVYHSATDKITYASCSVSADKERSVFRSDSGSLDLDFAFDDEEYHSALEISAVDLEPFYVAHRTSYEYETRDILTEKDA